MTNQPDYQAKYPNEEYRRVQLDPRMQDVYRKKDLKKSEKLFHLHKLWALLNERHTVGYPVSITIHDREQIPVKIMGCKHGTGLAQIYEDSHADTHIAIKNRSLFRALISMAHEYYHCIQYLIEGRWDEGTVLEFGADNFAYDFVTDYCKEVFLNEGPN